MFERTVWHSYNSCHIKIYTLGFDTYTHDTEYAHHWVWWVIEYITWSTDIYIQVWVKIEIRKSVV